jgi:hypothetical protein
MHEEPAEPSSNRPDDSRWRSRVARAATELAIIFLGVSAAFFVEGYREQLDQAQQLRQATGGIIAELARYENKSAEFADSIDASLATWRTCDQAGQRAIPGYFIIPGAPRPPTAAWNSAVSSGVASLYVPDLRLELGYFYTELVGIHDNYIRRLEFTEREILPRAEVGPDAFYDSTGHLRPEFAVEMKLFGDFGSDLRRLGTMAGSLRARLEKLQRQD